jgi:hypothetical protein
MTPEHALETPMSEPGRLTGVYFEPGKAFADIAARPRWWPPIVLLILASLVMMYCYSHRVGWESVVRQQVESSERTATLPADQREQAIARGAQFAGMIGYVGAVVGTPIVALVIAGALLFVFNTVFAASVKFQQALAISTYSMLPGLIAIGLAILVMYLKSPEDFDINNPLAFNLGALLSAESAKWMKALLSSFDLFTFWTMALLATGFVAAAKKRLAWSKAFTGVIVCWAVWVIVKTSGTALFS